MNHLDEQIACCERTLEEIRQDEHRLNMDLFCLKAKRRKVKEELSKLKAIKDGEHGKECCEAEGHSEHYEPD